MPMKYVLVSVCLLCCGTLPLHAQGEPKQEDGVSDVPQKKQFWDANVEGGQFSVPLGRITSVSRHRYVLDGSVIVDEVVVDTTGQALVRFYHITPITDEMRGSGLGNAAGRLVDRGKELIDRGSQISGSEIHNMVQKTFPHTTHAKQIEFRILSLQALGALHESVKKAWCTGRGRVFSIR